MAIADFLPKAKPNEYYLEVSIEKNSNKVSTGQRLPLKFTLIQKLLSFLFQPETSFSDIYGPYPITEEQSLIFAQQIKYDPLFYLGDYNIKTKIYHAEVPVVENNFEVKFE